MHFAKVFQEIESLLKMRCLNCQPPCHEIHKLFQDDWLDVYAPYGEEGPRVDLLSSISLVNRYWLSISISISIRGEETNLTFQIFVV